MHVNQLRMLMSTVFCTKKSAKRRCHTCLPKVLLTRLCSLVSLAQRVPASANHNAHKPMLQSFEILITKQKHNRYQAQTQTMYYVKFARPNWHIFIAVLRWIY